MPDKIPQGSSKAVAEEEARAQNERRQHLRATYKASINLTSESNFYTGFTDDLSEGGLFVATHNTILRGNIADIEFMLPDDDNPISVQGEVRWVREYRPENDAPPGMGLKFINLSDSVRQRITNFVKVRDTIFYDD